tara:strand:+ start:1634 stop:2194 length:561 start_codon:yes stop_codon:yes gene_type:complete
MKLSEFAAMQLGSEIVEEFERHENESEEPHDFDSNKTAELNDEDKFITNEEDYEFREKWAWYGKTVPKNVLDILVQIKTHTFYNIPGMEIILRDFYAKNVYEFYINPSDVDKWLKGLAKRYIALVEHAPDKAKFIMLDIDREKFEDIEAHVWPLVRGIAWPLSDIFGYDLNRLDELYMGHLIKQIS